MLLSLVVAIKIHVLVHGSYWLAFTLKLNDEDQQLMSGPQYDHLRHHAMAPPPLRCGGTTPPCQRQVVAETILVIHGTKQLQMLYVRLGVFTRRSPLALDAVQRLQICKHFRLMSRSGILKDQLGSGVERNWLEERTLASLAI